MNTVEPIRNKKAIKEIENILEKQGQRDLLIFLIGINCGLRISDILNLNVGDVKNKIYIDIIEKATDKNFDSEDWSVDVATFHNKIMDVINGVEGDETILEGKTRADVLPEKQAWLKYLEEHNMLLDQFKK